MATARFAGRRLGAHGGGGKKKAGFIKVLITGGCGFLGSNLAREALVRGDELCLIDDLSRLGSLENANYLKQHGEFSLLETDVRDAGAIDKSVRDFRPDAIFHLAGQVAMTTSINDPRRDFETNVLGGFNVLEAVRRFAPDCCVVYSSTNKVYGDLETLVYDETATRYQARDYPAGFDENLPLEFCSPYGCSKGAVDQYMLDYARVFGLSTVVFRHSSIFGERQFSTVDQGWVGWFAQQALAAKKAAASGQARAPFAVAGNGKQVRDVLFASDAVACYFAAAEKCREVRGQAFNLGGGMGNSLSLRELFALLENCLDVQLEYVCGDWRESDQKVFVADTGKVQRALGWKPRVSARAGVERMLTWMTR